MTAEPDLTARFFASVLRTSDAECWTWKGARDRSGYGQFYFSGTSRRAHRWAYEQFVGEIAPGAVIDHRCFNRACVNPGHLRQVAPKQNSEHRSGANRNSISGVRNVSWHAASNKWIVMVGHQGKQHYGGLYTNLTEATTAAVKLRGQFFTHDDGVLHG